MSRSTALALLCALISLLAGFMLNLSGDCGLHSRGCGELQRKISLVVTFGGLALACYLFFRSTKDRP
jgi:hypothetical protein